MPGCAAAASLKPLRQRVNAFRGDETGSLTPGGGSGRETPRER